MTSVGHRSLADLKVRLSAEVDRAAEAVRARFITLGPGQALVYEQKLREAEMILADPEGVQAGAVPNLAVEAADLGTDLFAAAVVVVTVAHQWAQMSAVIEHFRLGAKRAIAEAGTAAGARAAAVVDWSQIDVPG